MPWRVFALLVIGVVFVWCDLVRTAIISPRSWRRWGLIAALLFVTVFSTYVVVVTILDVSALTTRVRSLLSALSEVANMPVAGGSLPSVRIQPATDSLRITAPSGRALVSDEAEVEGFVADAGAEVWVVCHATDSRGYWVQKPADVRGDGTWRVEAYFGRPGDVDAGREYEIMAVADPVVGLAEGEVRHTWPIARWRSTIVTVFRESDLVVTMPSDGADVRPQDGIAGHVSPSRQDVWVIIHPVDARGFWVQPAATVVPHGAWRVEGYFGTSDSAEAGLLFQVMAVAGVEEPLHEGQVLGGWPGAKLRSRVVTVRRQ